MTHCSNELTLFSNRKVDNFMKLGMVAVNWKILCEHSLFVTVHGK